MDDLYTVELVQGLVVGKLGGTSTAYKRVHLRESCEKYLHDSIRAVEQMHRGTDGRMHLVHNQALFEVARIAAHIECFAGGGAEIRQPDIDLELLGKLHPLDVALIADRLLCIELAAQLRWGILSQDEYDLVMMGKTSNQKPLSPQETLHALKKVIDSISRVTSTSLDSLRVMPLAELEATLKNLSDSAS